MKKPSKPFKLADRVQVVLTQEAIDWGYKPCGQGAQGTIVGFDKIVYSALQAEAIKEVKVVEPGKEYTNKHWAQVKLDDGACITINTHYLRSAKRRVRKLASKRRRPSSLNL